MTGEPSPAAGDPGEGPLQFDRAEFTALAVPAAPEPPVGEVLDSSFGLPVPRAGPVVTQAAPAAPAGAAAPPPSRVPCSRCGQPIPDMYFELGGAPACVRCRDAVTAEREGGGHRRAAHAIVRGTLAGALGSIIYYAIRAATGYELGLIAILVGALVGLAVKRGSAGRGGLRYQLLAVFLTYCSIVATYVPYAIEGVRHFNEKRTNEKTAARGRAGPNQGAPVEASGAAPGTPRPGKDTAPRTGAAPHPVKLSPRSRAIFEVLAVVVLSAIAPFLAGAKNIIGILIIGFALYEAWKTSRAVPFVVRGPFRLSPARPQETPGVGTA